MDDLLLFTPNKQSHFEKLEDLCNISKSVIFLLHHDATLLCMCYIFMLFTCACDDGATS